MDRRSREPTGRAGVDIGHPDGVHFGERTGWQRLGRKLGATGQELEETLGPYAGGYASGLKKKPARLSCSTSGRLAVSQETIA